MKPMNASLKNMLAIAALSAAGFTAAQTVPIYGRLELSGTGATSGSNFDNGVKLGVKEISGKWQAGDQCHPFAHRQEIKSEKSKESNTHERSEIQARRCHGLAGGAFALSQTAQLLD